LNEQYTPEYFDSFKDSSRASAEVVVPIVMDWVNPKSVIDMGCGLGMWLSVWREAGCDVVGVDGHWVDRSQLAIPPDRFVTQDLSQLYVPERRYDLAMSVEAAEHLPPEAAAQFVRALTDASPLILFSASTPDQPGTDHLNCQWPTYWAELFAERGYDVIDTLRYMIWEDSRVDWWYRQNIMMYVARDQIRTWPRLASMYREGARPLRLVHPELMQTWLDWGMEQSRQYWQLRAKVDG
jgi:cyclopropane fatty-acyl-phospholipid synthase-like methyltransferase